MADQDVRTTVGALRKQEHNLSLTPMTINEKEDNKAPERVKNINDTHVQNETNGNHPDPTAKRNIGPNGETERRGQKDKLKNMHISGDEKSGYGANDPDSIDYLAQGPGFEVEGSFQEADGSLDGVRSHEQPFGSPAPDPEDKQDQRQDR